MSNQNLPSKSSSDTSPSLIAQSQKFEPHSWDRLVSLYGPRIRHWCRVRGLKPDSTADVEQDTWLSVARNLPAFSGTPGAGAFRAWLKVIVCRRIADHYRRQANQPQAIGGSSVQEMLHAISFVTRRGEASSTGGSENWQSQVNLAKSQHSDRAWEIFSRCLVDGQTTDAVAQEFGVTPANVRQIRSRVLKTLRSI
ncbi:MAG: sigma-70 family RNA polymerase sigma factor [Pirellula sp.]|nr:sigma-70 family RNA polymerase sigma factor [Pirellula sp.]